MFFIFQINFFIFFISFINIHSKEDVLYTPYSDYNHPSINSIYGTGNRTLDIIYRENCARLCGEKTYDDSHCCEGNTLEEEKCQSFRRCQDILDNFQRYVINIALISYFSLMFIVMVVVFFVYYCYTRDKKYKCKNAYSSSLVVFFAATIIPIIILQIYCWYKVITIEQYFGANFDKCFNISKSLQSVDVLDDQRPERRNIDNDINDNIDNNNNNNDDNTSPDINEKKLYQVNDNVNSNNPSQRSGSYMIEKPQN
jgi:predicted nucleic acid-binding Zn ribbon protein